MPTTERRVLRGGSQGSDDPGRTSGIFPACSGRWALPPGIVAHFRYPVDLFLVQAQVYATFHMTDPRVFYNREDVWASPTSCSPGTPQPLESYYVNLRLDPAVGKSSR